MQFCAAAKVQQPSLAAGISPQGGKALRTGKAVLEQAVINAGCSLRPQQHRCSQRGSICGKARVSSRYKFLTAAQLCILIPRDAKLIFPAGNLAAAALQKVQKRRQPHRTALRYRHPPACNGGGCRISRCGNAVRQHGMHTAVQQLAAGTSDADHRRTRPRDLCPAGVQKSGGIRNFRLARRTAQGGNARRTASRQHQGQGCSHAGQAQSKIRTTQNSVAAQRHALCRRAHLCPHGRQPGQVDINGPRPQSAPAGQRQLCPARAGQQRCQVKHRPPHSPRQRRGHPPADLPGWLGDKVLPGPGRPTAHSPQQIQTGLHIPQQGHPAQGAGLRTQQRCRQKGQHTVFGRCRADTPPQRVPACYFDIFHCRTAPLCSHTKAPFSIICRTRTKQLCSTGFTAKSAAAAPRAERLPAYPAAG